MYTTYSKYLFYLSKNKVSKATQCVLAQSRSKARPVASGNGHFHGLTLRSLDSTEIFPEFRVTNLSTQSPSETPCRDQCHTRMRYCASGKWLLNWVFSRRK